MSSVDLAPYEFLQLHLTKGGCIPSKHISVLRVREIDRIQKRLGSRVMLFCADAANAPTIWTMQCGQKRVKDIPCKKTKVITHIVSDGSFTGLFLLSKKGVDFVLLDHLPDQPWKLRSKPRKFSNDLNELMTSFYDQSSSVKKKRDITQGLFIVYNAQLKYFASTGVLILAVLVRDTLGGGLHLLLGSLAHKRWRRWDVEESYGVNSGIYIDPNSGTVTLMRCSIGTPVKAIKVDEAAPSVPFSLMVFDLIYPMCRNIEASHSNTIACALYHEFTVNLNDQYLPMQRTFQSLGFVIPPSERDSCRNCPVTIDSTPTPLFSFLLRVGGESFILQLTYSSNKDELVAVSHTLPATLQVSIPLALATMKVNENPHHLGGPLVTFILTKDLKLFAFDGTSVIEVRVLFAKDTTNNLKQIGQQMASERKLPEHQDKLPHTDSKADVSTATDNIKLLLVGQHELFCTDGKIAVFLHLTGVNLQKTSLNEKVMCIAADILEPKIFDESIACEKSLGLLSDIFASEPVGRQELGEIFLKEIAPILRRASKMPAYTPLIQRVFLLLLQIFSPVTDTDWQNFSTLARILQYSIDGQSCANHIVYTDQFFVNLINQYYRNNPNSKIEPHTINQKLREIISNKEEHPEKSHSIEDKEGYRKSGLSAEFQFFLDGLTTRAPLLSFAEEVVRLCVVLETLPTGAICAVLPKEGCEMVVHAMGIVLLASSFDIHLFVGVSNNNESITWSLVQKEPSFIDVPAYKFDDRTKVEYVFTLAVDLLCVKTTDLPYSLSIPIVLLTMSQRQHCLISLLNLFLPQILQSLDRETLALSNNTEWLENCILTLNKDPIEVVRTFIQAPTRETSLKGTTTATALCYALCGTGLYDSITLVNYVQESISQELCIASVVIFLFTMTEKLVDARNNYAASIARHILDKHDTDTLEAEEVVRYNREFSTIIENTRAAWVKADSVLPYKVHDIAASYEASISMSFSNSVILTENKSTIVLRTLVMCFRIFVLVYYSKTLEHRLEKTVLVCKKTVESCCDINQNYPAVHGSLEALHTIRTLKHSGLPVEKFQGQLMMLIEGAADICATGKHSKSAPWCFFFLHVLSLSGISETSIAPLKKRYYTLLDRLQSQLNKLANQEEMDRNIRSCVEKAKATGSTLSLDIDIEGKVFYFIFSHSRDSSIPQWVKDQALTGHKYSITTDWTQRMWGVEGKADIIKEATELLVSCIKEGTKKAVIFISEAGSNHRLKDQPKPLFDDIFHIIIPGYSHAGTECPIPVQDVQGSHDVEGEKASIEKEEAYSVDKEVVALKASSQEEPLVLENTPVIISQRPMFEVSNAEEIVSHTQSPPLVHSRVDPTFATSDQLAYQDIERCKSLSLTSHKGDHIATDPIEDGPALSDTLITSTTATSESFTGTEVSQKSTEEPLRSYDDNKYERMSTSSRIKYHRKRCHHHHHHHHCCCRCKRSHRQLDSNRVRLDKNSHGWIEEDQAARIATTWIPSEPQLCSNEVHNDLYFKKTGIQIQHSSTALRPPLESPRKTHIDDFNTPIYQRIDDIQSNGHGYMPQDINRGLSLLTFSRHQGQQSQSPRVRLYSAHLGDSGTSINELKQTLEWIGPTASSPFLNKAMSYTGAPHLEPPPIPSSDVFQKPPPLLHLRERVAISESGAITATANYLPTESVSTNPYKSTFPDGADLFQTKPLANASGPPQQFQQPQASQKFTERAPAQLSASLPSSNLLVQVPREPTVPMSSDDVELVPAQPASSTPILESNHDIIQSNTEAKSFSVPDVKQAHLTPIEITEFKRYVDDLMCKMNVVPSVPVPGAITYSATLPLASDNVSQEKYPQALPVTIDNSLSLKSEDIVLRSKNPSPSQPTLAPAPLLQSLPLSLPNGQNGLTSVEQAQLVQKTIKQKNELLNLTMELSEMQLRAAHIGDNSAFKPTAIVEEHKDHTLSYGKDQPMFQIQPSRNSDRLKLMSSVQIQTQQSAKNDVSVDAALPPFHLISTVPFRDSTTTTPVVSITNTISDLEHLNSKFQAINASTEAMEKALHETRETIRSYEKLKPMEAMGIKEIALINSLRCKTAAAERQLIELNGLPMATQMQSRPLEVQLPNCQKPCPGVSARNLQYGKDEITESEISAQQQSVVNTSQTRSISFSTCENKYLEKPERKEVNLTKQQQSNGAASELCNADVSDPPLLRSPSLKIKQSNQSSPNLALIAPWSPYQIETSALPNTHKYLSVKESVWKDTNESGEHAVRGVSLPNRKAISPVNLLNELSVCQGAPSHKSRMKVSQNIRKLSFVGPTNLLTVYQEAPRRQLNGIRQQRCRTPFHPQRSRSAVKPKGKIISPEVAANQLPSRTASKDATDRFYMYRSQLCIPKTSKKDFSRENKLKCVTPFQTLNNNEFCESLDVAVSNEVLPFEDGNQPKLIETSAFVERQRRRRSANIEKRIHQLEREFV
ncbi:unnamed protein product [Phytomonas sp. Hart1]|nr:unnamed protein product [Phytomonas sp. Hart1]|eukprot:CCW67517.1 unnamed protein product [Phytomonas sp. isolate Hart1]